ncbi:hypothetical protein DFH06DRAFT_1303650 [Mycena polygramma]|nr:hypothetical protein DFH06DRAFT_1303650 [Mycena polygramma]
MSTELGADKGAIQKYQGDFLPAPPSLKLGKPPTHGITFPHPKSPPPPPRNATIQSVPEPSTLPTLRTSMTASWSSMKSSIGEARLAPLLLSLAFVATHEHAVDSSASSSAMQFVNVYTSNHSRRNSRRKLEVNESTPFHNPTVGRSTDDRIVHRVRLSGFPSESSDGGSIPVVAIDRSFAATLNSPKPHFPHSMSLMGNERIGELG